MTVQATSDATLLASLQSAPAAKTDTDSADRFLKLLVTQLTNQDPLNPMDNAQVTSQMAQINTVQGIEKLNATLSTMAMDAASSQTLQAATMVGRMVLAEGNTLSMTSGQAAQGGYQLDAGADALTVRVKSASGEIVYSGNLGPQAAGMHLFNWDGMATNGAQAAPGTYSFEVIASAGGKSVAAQSLMLGRVDGVTPSADGVKLTLGGYGDVGISSVKHIL